MGNRFYQFLRPIANLVTTVVYRPKIYNKDLIPKNGGIIFAGNHLTDMDQLIVIKSTKRTIRFLTKKELYHGVLGKILEWYDTIPVDRENKDENQAMRLSEEALNNGQAINIFPEGKRNKTSDILLPFKFGAVSLAKKTNSYIVPFGVCGRLKPFGKRVVVNFGEPFKVDGDLAEANEILKEKIICLIEKGKEEYENDRK